MLKYELMIYFGVNMPKFNTKFAVKFMLCLAYFGLTACGTKGPLYIPEQRYPQTIDNQTTPEQNNPSVTTPN
jgi:predicted small lipoprotein YifL